MASKRRLPAESKNIEPRLPQVSILTESLYLTQCSQLQRKGVEQVGWHALPRLLLRIQPAARVQLSKHESDIVGRLLPAVSRSFCPFHLAALLFVPSYSSRPLSSWISRAMKLLLPLFGVLAFSVLGTLALCTLGLDRAPGNGRDWRNMAWKGSVASPVFTGVGGGAPCRRSPCSHLSLLQPRRSSLFLLFLLLLPLLGITFFVQL